MSYGSFPPVTRRRVVVTGIGAVTPLGSTMAATWSSLISGKSSGRRLDEVPFYLPPSKPQKRTSTAGGSGGGNALQQQARLREAIPCGVACPVVDDVGGDPYALNSRFAPTARAPRSHRFCQAAAEEALRDAGLLVPLPPTSSGSNAPHWAYADGAVAVNDRRAPPPRERVGVNIGMGIPSLTDVAETAAHLQLYQTDPNPNVAEAGTVCHYNRVHPFFVPKILGNMGAGSVALTYGFRGPIGSNVAACATGAHCIGEAARWIQDGAADVAVAGGTEACINPISIAGFARMRALATAYNDCPQEASRPFDVHRSGFVMGEGAGLLVLESLDSAIARGATIYAELRGFGCSSDAYHVSSPDPEGFGARSCVAAALQNAGVCTQDVGYVNAHATSTPMGDEIELKALAELFGADRGGGARRGPLLVSSSKGALGHLLGAAGSVEAAITVLALQKKIAPPNVNLKEAIPHDTNTVRLNVDPVPIEHATPMLAAISTSFGFGGVNTALVFTSYVAA